ncbi:MAG TPA: hypothetical protein QF611_10625, partial [Pseudomonadales bacterium]|nr:hypothetical protein [Pseudomonadales bacterium]
MSIQEVGDKKPDIQLNLRSLLNDLVADGRLSTADADQLSLKIRSNEQIDWHPLELIAEDPPDDQKNP